MQRRASRGRPWKVVEYNANRTASFATRVAAQRRVNELLESPVLYGVRRNEVIILSSVGARSGERWLYLTRDPGSPPRHQELFGGGWRDVVIDV
jgi:hypothetical protein